MTSARRHSPSMAGRPTKNRALDISADIERLLVAGRLSQRCPGCGLREAAGFYCSRCCRPTGPADWRRGDTRSDSDVRRGTSR
jgi:methionyl-tRNA synthetase